MLYMFVITENIMKRPVSVSLLLTLFLNVYLGASNPFDLFFNLIYSLLTAFMAYAIFICPAFYAFFGPSTTQNSVTRRPT